MEEIKNLFIKYFRFYPDIISTTEHAYISPPSRIISTLSKLSNYKNKKILRIVITDTFSFNPESCVKQICIPYFLDKNIFTINNSYSKEDIIVNFEKDISKMENILKDINPFSLKEKINYNEIMDFYKNILKNVINIDPVYIYNNIIKEFSLRFDFFDLYKWLQETNLYSVDSREMRSFLVEAFEILSKHDPLNVNLFIKYIEVKKRLKYKDSTHVTHNVLWNEYLYILKDFSILCSVPFEIILYVYSYCGGSHFGNDYLIVNDINKIRGDNCILQLTEHNKDYFSNLEIKDVPFQEVSFVHGTYKLLHKIYKTINTLPELYVILGFSLLKEKLFNDI